LGAVLGFAPDECAASGAVGRVVADWARTVALAASNAAMKTGMVFSIE
jgi:hypothetical protein